MNKLNDIINQTMKETGIKHSQALAIYESFFISYTETDRLLQVYLENQNFEAMYKLAHQLKGTSANLRIDSIMNAAKLIEDAANTEYLLLIAELVTKINMEVHELRKQMLKAYDAEKLDILIVEDNPINSKMLEQILINLGNKPIGVVSTPEQVLLFVKQRLPDLIFMDIELSSVMNGIHTAELLSGYYSVPIVFVSVHADEATIMNATRFSIGYIVKPFMPSEIEEMISRVKNMSSTRLAAEKRSPQLKVKLDNRIILIDLEEIILFESQLHMVIVHTGNAKYEIRSNMRTLRELDQNNLFITVHQSFMVNKRYVDQLINENYHYSLKLKGYTELVPVSKANVKAVKQLFA
jgi:two-component system LytT family response regulator